MSNSACKSKVFARSLHSLKILAQAFKDGTDICSIVNRTKQIASLRFAHATAAPSCFMRSLKLVIKSTFSSFDLFLSSESFYSIVNPVMHQTNLSFRSILRKVPISERVFSEWFSSLLQSDVKPPLSTINSPIGLSFLRASQRRQTFRMPSVSSSCLVSSPPDNCPWCLCFLE